MNGTIGEVRMFGGNFAPRTWAFCDGQLLAISSNTALFSILGTTYGGDGRTTFALPEMRGRSCVQQGNGPGLSHWSLGEKGGVDDVSLTLSNLPAHSHYFIKDTITATSAQRAFNDEGIVDEPDGAYPCIVSGKPLYAATEDGVGVPATTSVTNTLAAARTGNNQSYDNYSPYTAVNFIICMLGVFPSRS